MANIINLFLNEKLIKVNEGISLYELKNDYKKDADVIILNGFPQKEDKALKNNDRVVFIKKGEKPNKNELEALMVSRHTPGIFNKLKNSKVGIAGVGGLGSNIALSLARIGVGTLKLVDFDVVEPSNLNRQQFFVDDIGKYKVDAMSEIINKVNPFIKVYKCKEFLNSENIERTFSDVDIIIEAFDNPESKAVLCNKVLIDMKDKYLIAGSGMAGYFSSNSIETRKIRSKFYVCGDGENAAKEGQGLMAPRVSICANHMANMAVRIICNKEDV